MSAMTVAAIVLLIAGIVLLGLEAFAPGFGISGGLGLAAMFASAVIMAVWVPFGIFYAAAELALILLGGYMFFKAAKKKGLPSKLVLDETLGSEPEDQSLMSFIGKEGVVYADLRPVGTVNFAGAVIEAYSDGPYVEAGARVLAIRAEEGRIVVRREEGKARTSNEN